MSFRFNWDRLDETAAEAIRLLINRKLQELLEEKLGGGGPSMGVHGDRHGSTSAVGSGGGGGPTGSGGGGTAGGSAVGAAAANSESVSALGGGSLAAMEATANMNLSPHHSLVSHGPVAPQSASGSPAGGAAVSAFAPSGATLPSGAGTGQTTAAGAAAMTVGRKSPATPSVIVTPATGGSGAAAGSVHVAPNGTTTMAPVAPTSAAPVSLPTLGTGSLSSQAGSGAAVNVLLSAVPQSPSVSTMAGVAAAAAGPAGPANAAARASSLSATAAMNTAGASGAPHSPHTGHVPSAAKQRKPLLEHLTVTSLEWGTTPPFVELVNFSDALTFAEPETPRVSSGPPATTSFPSSVVVSPHFPPPLHHLHHHHPGSSSTSHLHGRQSPQLFPPPTASAAHASPCHHHSNGNGNTVGGCDALSECSTGNNVSAGNLHGGGMGSAGLTLGRIATYPAASTHSQLLHPSASSAQPSAAPSKREASEVAEGEVVDTLAPYLGPGGLFVRLHVTYGGSLRVSVASAVQYDLSVLGSFVTLPLRMPLALHISDIDMDCYVCCNLHKNACRLWLEPGKLSSSPINRLSATAVFGEKRRHPFLSGGSGEGSHSGFGFFNGGGAGGCAAHGNVDGNAFDAGEFDEDSSCFDYYSRYGSSPSDDGEDGDTVLVDERQVEQFLVRELKALLKDRIVAPHFVSVPVVLGQ